MQIKMQIILICDGNACLISDVGALLSILDTYVISSTELQLPVILNVS